MHINYPKYRRRPRFRPPPSWLPHFKPEKGAGSQVIARYHVVVVLAYAGAALALPHPFRTAEFTAFYRTLSHRDPLRTYRASSTTSLCAVRAGPAAAPRTVSAARTDPRSDCESAETLSVCYLRVGLRRRRTGEEGAALGFGHPRRLNVFRAFASRRQ
ncbi:hypothetical protein BGW80DRAFT_610523 [Lactifluus volemus]|nr:hypothetical protein BGW80DRAFT_610523 [Lactifluus volemus]